MQEQQRWEEKSLRWFNFFGTTQTKCQVNSQADWDCSESFGRSLLIILFASQPDNTHPHPSGSLIARRERDLFMLMSCPPVWLVSSMSSVYYTPWYFSSLYNDIISHSCSKYQCESHVICIVGSGMCFRSTREKSRGWWVSHQLFAPD